MEAHSDHDVSPAGIGWDQANRAFLEAELRRLRLLLHRRVLWLRQQWREDPLPNTQGMIISDAQVNWALAGEDREAELRFYREGHEAAVISRLIDEVSNEIGGLEKTMEEAGAMPAAKALASQFELSRFEVDVLLLCLAPQLDPSFERLYGYVHDDINRRFPTPHLAISLLYEEHDLDQARNCFLPDAPLRYLQLVTLDPGAPASALPALCPLHLDGRIADYLRGVLRTDERVAELVRALQPAPLSAAHLRLVERLVGAIEAGVGNGTRPVFSLVGPPKSGRRAVAHELGRAFGLQLCRLELGRLPAEGEERRQVLRLLSREAVLAELGYLIEVPESEGGSELEVLDRVTEELAAFLVLASREQVRLEAEVIAVPVPTPSARDQLGMWQAVLGETGQSLDRQLEALTQQFCLGPQEIVQAGAAAATYAQLDGGEADPGRLPGFLWQACREQAGWQLEELARRIDPCFGWEDIVLPDDVLRQLQEVAAQVALRAKVYEGWGFGDKLSRGRGISALFSGPSGTGKTMAAEIVANHLQLDLYRIDLAGVVSKYIGETEKNLRKVFDAAESSGAILFFDEADALFGKRSEVKDSHDRYANIEVNYLLQRMEDYRGLASLAPNRKSALDRAFLRRLRFLVDFPFPDLASRRRIWHQVFPPAASVEQLDLENLARLEIAGGNIRNIALNAAFLAAADDVAIALPHLMHAARREYDKIDKLMTQTEFGEYFDVGGTRA